MKKYLLITLGTIILLIFIKYYVSDYVIKYSVGDFSIVEKYEDGRYYYELKSDKEYNFDIYKSRSLGKKLIKDIDVVMNEDSICIYPKSKKINTYPLCYENNKYISYYLVNNQVLKDYISSLNINYLQPTKSNEEFSFYNDLEESTYVALWAYNGFYLMNGENVKNITLFKKGKYDNSLCSLVNNKLVLPDYDEDLEFSNFYIVDITSGKYTKIETKYDIDYDSYIVGSIKNKLYLFDKKYYNLYEINVKKEKVELIGDEKKGYIKFINGKIEEAKLNDYKLSTITIDNDSSNYIYEISDGIYKTMADNKDLKSMIFNKKKSSLVGEYKDNVYFIYEDALYEYNPLKGIHPIFNYFELNFNSKDMIFVYNK